MTLGSLEVKVISKPLNTIKTMKKIFLSALAVAALMFVGCTNDLTDDLKGGAEGVGETVVTTLDANIAEMSRTSLAPGASGSTVTTVWSEGDAIGVVTAEGLVRKGVLTSGAGTATAKFAITGETTDVYTYAFYPYLYGGNTELAVSEIVGTAEAGSIQFSFPVVQTYKAGSVFAENTNTMVAAVSEGAANFQSIVGALEIRLKGSQTVKGITVKSGNYKAKMAGLGTVDLTTMEPVMGTANTSFSFINLDVPEGVKLNTATATSFFVLMPPGEYENLMIGVQAEDGSYVQTASKTHSISACMVSPINCGNLDEMIDKASAVNLSAEDTANCYQFKASGAEKTYCFDIKRVDGTVVSSDLLKTRYVTGTGEEGDPVAGHATEAEVAPNFAHVLWSEDLGLAYDVHFDKAAGKIYFKHDGKAVGNTRIMILMDPFAAQSVGSNGIMRCDLCTIWGWHIWVTPDEVKQSITKAPYQAKDLNEDGKLSRAEIAAADPLGFMDRNLGATWTPSKMDEVTNITAQQAADALGLYFQGGNLHPYPRPKEFGNGGSANNTWDEWQRAIYQYGFQQYNQSWAASGAAKESLEDNWQYPYYRYSTNYTPADQYNAGSTGRTSWVKMDFRLGGVATDTEPIALWGGNGPKLNYDPCPPGYKIPHQGNLYQITTGQSFTNFIEDGASETSSASGKTFQVVPDIKFNERYVGTCITYNKNDIDLHPAGGYFSTGKITFNASGNIAYLWGAPYATSVAANDAKKAFNAGVKACFHNNPNSSNYSGLWPQPGTPYQIRCIKE